MPSLRLKESIINDIVQEKDKELRGMIDELTELDKYREGLMKRIASISEPVKPAVKRRRRKKAVKKKAA